MVQENISNSSLNYQLLRDITNLVLKTAIELSKQAKKDLYLSYPLDNEDFCRIEDIYLKKHLKFNSLGVLGVLAKIQEKYNVEISCFKKQEQEADISFKEICNCIINRI
jgi:hypothetical protein